MEEDQKKRAGRSRLGTLAERLIDRKGIKVLKKLRELVTDF